MYFLKKNFFKNYNLFKKIHSPYTYNYSLSFWLYINTFHFKKNTESAFAFASNGIMTVLFGLQPANK